MNTSSSERGGDLIGSTQRASPRMANLGSGYLRLIGVGLMLLFFAAIYGRTLFTDGLWWTDESRHAMHGVFFVDFVRDWSHSLSMDYVQRYFAQYPALAFNWYLPFFPALVGLAMLLFGTSETTAQGVVLTVWLIGVLLWYDWLARRFGTLFSVLGCLTLISLPVAVLWGRSMMLEAPAVAMCLIGIVFSQRYLERPSMGRALVAGFSLMAMVLVKQTTLFILPVLLIHALAWREYRTNLWRVEALWGLLPVLIGVTVVIAHAILFGPEVMKSGETYSGSGAAPLDTWQRWVTYAHAIHKEIGSGLLLLAGMGMLLAVADWKQRIIGLMLLWLILAYGWVTYLTGIPGNSERYVFYIAPALTFFAAYGVYRFIDRLLPRALWAAALALSLGLNSWAAVSTPPRFVNGYAKAAALIHALPKNGTILFAGKHDGNFILALRQLDRERQRVVLRGDKTLVQMSVNKYFGVQERVQAGADIDRFLQAHGVRWIVVEQPELVGLRSFALLNERLRSTHYRLIARIPVETNVPEYRGLQILIYENLQLELPADGRLTIDYPYLGRRYTFTFPDAQTR